ncbi:MAG: L-aspartate oxidase, partial [Pseudomonadota bacterium]|nr:L-aspartate oxidase [Pseudomonadota bacterium]
PLGDLPQTVLTELRARMTLDAGVARDGAGLAGLVAWIGDMQALHGPAAPLVAARLIAQGALDRCESRGAHFRADFPATAEIPIHTRMTVAPHDFRIAVAA